MVNEENEYNKIYKYILCFLLVSLIDIKLYKLIIIAMCYWVCSIYMYYIFNNITKGNIKNLCLII